MHGNVWEWIEDDWHNDYNGAPINGKAWINDPREPSRVVRGGSWHFTAEGCRSAFRKGLVPGICSGNIGFRLILPLDQQT
jgi:formylglycine-generating enzyme required for sulfatase activity